MTSCVGSGEDSGVVAANIVGTDVIDDVSTHPDPSVRAVSDGRRDAVILVRSGGVARCGGVLVTPRIVATAAHCVFPSMTVRFGQDWDDEGVFVDVGVDACFAHPDVLSHLGVDDPPCELFDQRRDVDGDGRIEDHEPLHRDGVNALDWAVLVLDRRVDRVNGTAVPATPAEIIDRGLPGGTVLRWASRSHTEFSRGRVFVDGLFSSLRDGYLLFDPAPDVTSNDGDSGSPVYFGDPDDGAIEVVSVGSRLGPLASTPAWDPAVAVFLQPFLDDDAISAGRFVGISDVPARGNPERTADHDDVDPDQDGLVGAHDNCLGTDPEDYNPDQLDTDDDGLGDTCDFCEGRRGGGTDTDGDTVGDACDNCPGVPGPQTDSDFDPARRSRPDGGDVCDNCDLVYNLTQANCNLDSEIVVGVEPLGDLCDPTPCGATTIETRTETTSRRGSRVTIVSQDRVVVDTLADADTRTLLTGFRWCPCSAAGANDSAARVLCRAPQDDGTGTCSTNDINGYGVAAESLSRWRWTTTGPDSEPTPATAVLRSAVYGRVVAAHERNLDLRWFASATDVPRWRRFFPGLADETLLRGVHWTHTRAVPAGLGGGVPRPPVLLPEEVRRLANNYRSGPVTPDLALSAVYPYPCYRILAPFVGSSSLSSLFAWTSPQAFIAVPGLSRSGSRCIEPAYADLLLVTDVVVRPSVDPVVLPGFENFGEPVTQWIAASEVGALLPERGLRYVAALPGAGTPVVEQVLIETSLGYEPLLPNGGLCPNPNNPNCPQGPFAASAARETTPPGEPGVLVLSAYRGFLWRIGGTDAGARPLDTIGLYDVEQGRWIPIWLPGVFGRVLAATYSAVDDALYVLDESRADTSRPGRAGRVRLLRLDPDDDEVTTIREWPRLTHNDVFAMGVGENGDIWIAGSRTDGNSHVVLSLRYNADDELEIVSSHGGAGTLEAYGLRAMPRGVTLAVQDRGGQRLVAYEPREHVPPSAADRLF